MLIINLNKVIGVTMLFHSGTLFLFKVNVVLQELERSKLNFIEKLGEGQVEEMS
jgi:hypothetical protein